MRACEAPDCENEFEPKRSTARFCGATCRQRAARSRRAAEAEAQAETDPAIAEHGLVKAIRQELTEAGKLDSFKGQLALQLARRMANPDESSPAALAKALENAMAAALGVSDGAPPPAEPQQPADPDDEIRKKRDAKRQAAREASS